MTTESNRLITVLPSANATFGFETEDSAGAALEFQRFIAGVPALLTPHRARVFALFEAMAKHGIHEVHVPELALALHAQPN